MNSESEHGSTRGWEMNYTEKILKMTGKKVSNWTLKSKDNKLNKLKTWLGSWFSEYLKNLTCSETASDSHSFLIPVIPLYFTSCYSLFKSQPPTDQLLGTHWKPGSNGNIVHSINRKWMLPRSRSSKRWGKMIDTQKMSVSTSFHWWWLKTKPACCQRKHQSLNAWA